MLQDRLIFSHFSCSFFLFFLLFASCSHEESKPRSIGKNGEIVVVIATEQWEGVPGNALKNVLTSECPGLPQSEPLFDLVNIPFQSFANSILSNHACVLLVNIHDTIVQPSVTVKRDVWAKPQYVMKLSARDSSSFRKLVSEYAERLVSAFSEEERKRLQEKYKKNDNHFAEEEIKVHFGFDVVIPDGFVPAVKKKNFMWLRKEDSDLSKGIILYTTKYRDTAQFSTDALLAVRDSVIRKYIPGPSDSSWMTTERRLPVHRSVLNFDKQFAVELRGLWKVEGDFMGGPFVSLSVYDKKKDRVITAEGFVYSPKYDKREHLRSVEAVVYSLKP